MGLSPDEGLNPATDPAGGRAVAADPRAGVDPLLNSPGREGLAGTAPASRYDPPKVRDQITLPPDGRARGPAAVAAGLPGRLAAGPVRGAAGLRQVRRAD